MPIDIDPLPPVAADESTIAGINVEAKTKIAWIVETRCVDFWAYSKIVECESALDHIFTFDTALLERSDKYKMSLIASS